MQTMKPLNILLTLACALAVIVCVSVQAETGPRVLIVYHGGVPPWKPAPPLGDSVVDALTQATTEKVNVETVAGSIRDHLEIAGCKVDLMKAVDVDGPDVFLSYDGIIFGTPTWFSNVAYPIKRIFDEHLIRIYEHREGRLNDKTLAGFTMVMERGESGPNCLASLTHGIEHLSRTVVRGAVVNTGDDDDTVNGIVADFSKRFMEAVR